MDIKILAININFTVNPGTIIMEEVLGIKELGNYMAIIIIRAKVDS